VVRVPPKMMAGVRRSARTRGKSDPIDALAVARAALREPGLPMARLDGPARELRLLVDYREGLIRERTGLQNRLRWRLHELEAGWDPPVGSLDRLRVLDELGQRLESCRGMVAELARREVARIRQLTVEANHLERAITTRVAVTAPTLLAVPGCGALTAAKLVGETADVTRFSSRDAYAMFAGTAPIPVWSANSERFRLNRGGNRQINTAIHRIAITQMRIHPDARRLITKHMTAGKTKTEALRVLKRRLTDIVYRALQQDTQTACQAAPARAA
jgi:transposase